MENKTKITENCSCCGEPFGPDGRCYNNKCKEYDPLSQYFDDPSETDASEEFVPSEELVRFWFQNLLKEKGKSSLDALTAGEIREKIEEVEGTIGNERLWAHVNAIHWENIAVLETYLAQLKELLNEAEQKNVVVPEQEWRIVMVSEGGTKHHFMGGYKSEEAAATAAGELDWRFVDDNCFEWRLEVEEDCSSHEKGNVI